MGFQQNIGNYLTKLFFVLKQNDILEFWLSILFIQMCYCLGNSSRLQRFAHFNSNGTAIHQGRTYLRASNSHCSFRRHEWTRIDFVSVSVNGNILESYLHCVNDKVNTKCKQKDKKIEEQNKITSKDFNVLPGYAPLFGNSLQSLSRAHVTLCWKNTNLFVTWLSLLSVYRFPMKIQITTIKCINGPKQKYDRWRAQGFWYKMKINKLWVSSLFPLLFYSYVFVVLEWMGCTRLET